VPKRQGDEPDVISDYQNLNLPMKAVLSCDDAAVSVSRQFFDLL
jgi:hypothetical protein